MDLQLKSWDPDSAFSIILGPTLDSRVKEKLGNTCTVHSRSAPILSEAFLKDFLHYVPVTAYNMIIFNPKLPKLYIFYLIRSNTHLERFFSNPGMNSLKCSGLGSIALYEIPHTDVTPSPFSYRGGG